MAAQPSTRSWRRWLWRIAFGAVTIAVLAAGAAVLTFALGRPKLSVSSDGSFLHVHLTGFETHLTSIRATSGGDAVPLVDDSGNLTPAAHLSQGATVTVSVTARPPAWLRWLLGSDVSAVSTEHAPAAAPVGTTTLGPAPGKVPVRFNRRVSVVDYSSDGGPQHVVHVVPPSRVVDLTVPTGSAVGTVEVAAAPLPWERVGSHPSKLMWFIAPPGSAPPVLVSPSPGTTSAASNQKITFVFAQPVAQVLGASRPSISPRTPGSWTEPEANELVFTPTGFGFGPGASVSVRFDRPLSMLSTSVAGAVTTAATTSDLYHFSVQPGSVLRLEQILAQLGYLPLNFVPAASVTPPTTLAGEVASMSQPLPGTFEWRWPSTPASLQAQWSVGSPNVMLQGALMAFIAEQEGANYNGYQVDAETVAQLASPSTWDELLQAAVSNATDPNPYAYVYVTKTLPETLTLWENGSVVLTSPANTGIPQDPTADGTYPIYLRFTQNYMSGTNPDGSTYHDLVYWINYFNGSDAVHGFPRAAYGFPQSLGCVELPIPTAAQAFKYLTIGDLVTVTG
jgi:lipoprotein-anchoring transpeptidase ErfK/SrfK